MTNFNFHFQKLSNILGMLFNMYLMQNSRKQYCTSLFAEFEATTKSSGNDKLV